MKIDVSIFMLTYNQEHFIAQSIESVLMQKTNFVFQLVIGEDCSLDNTRSICEEFAINNPEKIKLLDSTMNLGLIENFIRTYKECDGKYIAILDGDDYWTDPLKLQKQFDFLENNADYSIVFTGFKFLFPDGRIVHRKYSNTNTTTGFIDLIFENYIPSVTSFFRNKKNINDIPNWLDKCPYGDWPLYLWTTKDRSKVKFLEDYTAVYRKEIGVSEKMKLVPSTIALENLKIVEQVQKDTHFEEISQEIENSVKNHLKNLLACYIREARFLNSFKLTYRLARKYPIDVLAIYSYIMKRKIFS